MINRADVYERNGYWYFQTFSETVTGLLIATEPIFYVHQNDSRHSKVDAAIKVLGASRVHIPIPKDNEELSGTLLALAKARSWADFMIRAKGICLRCSDGLLTVTPYRKLKRPRGALELILDQSICVKTDAPPEEIGAVLEEAMSRSC